MINRKTVLGITLARGGSKSIARKNVINILGRPLISYTFNEAVKSKYIDRYVVSTEDAEIRQICEYHKIEVVDRPKELATDSATSADALVNAVESLSFDCDYVVEIMATNPLKSAEDVDACIEMLDDSGSNSVVAVTQVYDHHPARLKFIKDGKLHNFYPEVPESRRQDLTPHAYVRCGSIYAMKTDFLQEAKARYDEHPVPYIMPPERVVNIDEPIDLKIAETMLNDSMFKPS